MRTFEYAPIKSYFIAIGLIVAVLFLTFTAALYRQYTQVQNLNSWVNYNYEVTRQVRLALLDMLSIENGVHGYTLARQNVFLQDYDDSIKSIRQEYANLMHLTQTDPALRAEILDIFQEINKAQSILTRELERFQQDGYIPSPEEARATKMKMNDLKQIIDTFINDRLEDLKKRLSQSRAEQNNFTYTLFIGIILVISSLILSMSVIFLLIDRNRKANDKINENEDRLLRLMSGINDAFYDFDIVTRAANYSPSYLAMLGYNDTDKLDSIEDFKESVHPDDYERVMEKRRKYCAHEIPSYSDIFRIRHKNGTWRWVLSRAVGIWDEKGIITRLIGSHTDITDQKTKEEELKQLTTDMETFTYLTSHDLRAPLVNLKGFSQEIDIAMKSIAPALEKCIAALPPEDQKVMTEATQRDIPESLRFIVQSVERMDSLTNALLNLSRIGKREYYFEYVDTGALISRCVNTFGYDISQKGAAIDCIGLPVIVSDTLALEQIFSNLIDNAIKYLDPARTGKITISAQETTQGTTFSIEDNGRGIADEDREKIFQIFRRARNTRNVRGLGMGMTFVQTTVRRLGGKIWFESKYGVGTTFYVHLPKLAVQEIQS